MSKLIEHLPEPMSRAREGNPNAKLTHEIVADIITTRRATGASAGRIAVAVSAAYGISISASAVRMILRGKSGWNREPVLLEKGMAKPRGVPLVGVDVEEAR